ncbi:Serine/Threonine kinase domain protein (macronuclear) [Tetrahymena thermophila SB210]|uniref:Serine/Threonine kinase domain protein n=1 Tax=Tetrahymena thermophila (strain SB210) TaxID=312017 RepID=Q238Y8_TETTS|nr:Serine/Threonine kinase domain protein [Tetrahymena thermophila SB210]EAR93082.2 Serine/Threonine kinase domain protein [Tetrahymena thermophila SB210]|eukprot:XP_001013327.2 Serine/Threonine kinase domain protein [Tetrahymena thermophila SB210]
MLIGDIGFDQNQPIIWNSNGIQSESSFSLYQIINDILSIKIYYPRDQTSVEIQTTQIKNILHVSQFNDTYIFYLRDNLNTNIVYYITKNKQILKLELSYIPNIMQLNFFTSDSNKCLYYLKQNVKYLDLKQIFCLENEDEFEEIQYFGGDQAVISSKYNTYVFNNNMIDQILPNTNIYLFNYVLDQIQFKIIDFSESFKNLQSLPKFNYNYQYQQNQYFLMSYRDPSSDNSQKVLYIYQIILNYSDFVKVFAQQSDDQIIYLSMSQGKIIVTLIDEQNNDFSYQQFSQLSYQNPYLPTSQKQIKALIFQSVVCLFFTFLLAFLIKKRNQKRQEVLARLEDLIFKQAIKISKEQFEKKYEIDFRDSLGSGSYGDVYKVKNKHKEIIKNQEILSTMPDFYACKQICVTEQMSDINSSVFHEIEVLEKLKKYDHVIKLQNYFVANRSTYLILDLAESTLQEQINLKQANLEQFNQEEIVKFLVQIGKTLALIYSDEGIVHRDLKPSNILIREGNYYLSDFGCAQELFQSEQIRNNVAFGTLKWMSPELREMKRDQKINFFKSDVFSLGMILLYMLTLTDISQVNCDVIFKQAKIRLMKNMYKDTKYSQILLLVIRMIETNPDHRPDSSILIQTIEEIQSQKKTSD